jgi:2-methylisocitrate lyase-like PEP mutase family enzyme
VAADTRSTPDCLLVARTDARATHDLDEALFRADAFAEAGADILFIEAPQSEDELRLIGERFDLPLMVNVVEGGATPVLPLADYEALGFRLAIYPLTGFAAQAIETTYRALQAAERPGPDLMPFSDICELMGFSEVWAFEQAHAAAGAGPATAAPGPVAPRGETHGD